MLPYVGVLGQALEVENEVTQLLVLPRVVERNDRNAVVELQAERVHRVVDYYHVLQRAVAKNAQVLYVDALCSLHAAVAVQSVLYELSCRVQVVEHYADDYLDQIKRVIGILGTPSSEDMQFIGNDLAKKFVRSLPKRNKQSWATLFPKSNPVALDLLGKMMAFNPEKRYSIKQCLAHPYFEGLHNELAEPLAEEPFDWSWDNFKPTKEILQNMVYDESLPFHPEDESEGV